VAVPAGPRAAVARLSLRRHGLHPDDARGHFRPGRGAERGADRWHAADRRGLRAGGALRLMAFEAPRARIARDERQSVGLSGRTCAVLLAAIVVLAVVA